MGPSGTDSALDGEADGSRDPQTERTLTILQIKKLGREIDCEGIHAAAATTGRGGENMGKSENGPAVRRMDNDVRQ